MKIKEYIKNLQIFAKAHPNLDVVYSCDDEGNAFDLVHFKPTLGHFRDGEFTSGTDMEEQKMKINSVCVN